MSASERAAAVDAGRRSTTFAYYLAFVGLGLVLASPGPTIPDLAQRTGSTLSAFSILFIAHSVGYPVGALLGGRLFEPVSPQAMFWVILIDIGLGLGIWTLLRRGRQRGEE